MIDDIRSLVGKRVKATASAIYGNIPMEGVLSISNYPSDPNMDGFYIVGFWYGELKKITVIITSIEIEGISQEITERERIMIQSESAGIKRIGDAGISSTVDPILFLGRNVTAVSVGKYGSKNIQGILKLRTGLNSGTKTYYIVTEWEGKELPIPVEPESVKLFVEHKVEIVHPTYYNKGNIEVWDFWIKMGLDGLDSVAVKHICRAGHKKDMHLLYDFAKAKQYLQKSLITTKTLGDPQLVDMSYIWLFCKEQQLSKDLTYCIEAIVRGFYDDALRFLSNHIFIAGYTEEELKQHGYY